MTGRGRAHGAVTVLNATATGVGCSLAIEGGAEAAWTWAEGSRLAASAGTPDTRLVEAVRRQVAPPPGRAGCRVEVHARFPPARGLKTSSSAAAALLQAARRAAGGDLQGEDLARAAVQASRSAGVTLTGALDDQLATVLGGCHVADNRAGLRLRSLAVPPWEVAVWVPAASIEKARVASVATAAIGEKVAALAAGLRSGHDVPAAMTKNGRLYASLYREARLPVSDLPAEAALAAGALGAGLSGTGPAVAALFEDPVDLPDVPGGRWEWSRVVEGPR